MRPIALDVFGDTRGELGVLEFARHLPFAVSRLFYVRPGDPPLPRGEHACSVDEVLIALAGDLVIDLDNGREQQSFRLGSPQFGLLICRGVWLRMHSFHPNCVLAVLAEGAFADSVHFDTPQPHLLDGRGE